MLLLSVMFFLSVFSLIIYPFLLMIIPKNRENESPVTTNNSLSYSVVIAAYNAEQDIKKKIDNLIAIKNKNSERDIQIIIVSDASTDSTASIVKQYADYGIEFYEYSDRQGKEYAQIEGLKKSNGDIIIFTDVAANADDNCISVLDRVFSDKNIGAVSSVDQYFQEKNPSLLTFEKLYIRYEMWLRSMESQRSGLIGMSGSYMAVRKDVTKGMGLDTCSDFWLALNAKRLGYRCVQADDLICHYSPVLTEKSNIERRARTVSKGIMGFWHNRRMLNPVKYPLYAFQLFSHKVMRWVAVPAAAIFFLSIFLMLSLYLQLAIIGLTVLLTMFVRPVRKLFVFGLSLLASFVIAFWRICSSNTPRYWSPSRRTE